MQTICLSRTGWSTPGILIDVLTSLFAKDMQWWKHSAQLRGAHPSVANRNKVERHRWNCIKCARQTAQSIRCKLCTDECKWSVDWHINTCCYSSASASMTRLRHLRHSEIAHRHNYYLTTSTPILISLQMKSVVMQTRTALRRDLPDWSFAIRIHLTIKDTQLQKCFRGMQSFKQIWAVTADKIVKWCASVAVQAYTSTSYQYHSLFAARYCRGLTRVDLYERLSTTFGRRISNKS